MELSQKILDALSSHIVLLDNNGKIIMLNKAWLEFAKNNAHALRNKLEGINYLEICRNSKGEGSDEAKRFADGIEKVLKGKSKEYVEEYHCRAKNKTYWFIGRVTPIEYEGKLGAVVSHEDITEIRREDLREKTEIISVQSKKMKDIEDQLEKIEDDLNRTPI